MNRAKTVPTRVPSGPDDWNSIDQVYVHPSPSGVNEWVAIARTGRDGFTFSRTMRRPGSHSLTTDTTCIGRPHILNRIRLRVPSRIGRESGLYSRTAGSITGAVDGSARNANAYSAGTPNRVVSENPGCCTPATLTPGESAAQGRVPDNAGNVVRVGALRAGPGRDLNAGPESPEGQIRGRWGRRPRTLSMAKLKSPRGMTPR